MKSGKYFSLAVVALAVVAASCGSGESSVEQGSGDELSGQVIISGSSTVEPISSRVKELYNESVSESVEISVSGPGTSAGFKEFCAGSTDINNASRQIKDTEIESCAEAGVVPVELRVAFDGIAVLVHPDNPLTCLSLTDLYAIVGPESEEISWEQAQAFAEGSEGADGLGSATSGQTWPTGDIDVIAPGTESGTYGSFIEIVLEDLGEGRSDLEDGAGHYTPQTDENGDPVFINTRYAGQPDDNVILEGIANSPGGFGWVGFAFAAAAGDSIKVLQVADEEGNCVAPSLDTIASGEYPVSRSLYIYVNSGRLADNQAMVSYVDHYLGDASPDAVVNAFDEGVGYVSLPDDLEAATDATWAEAKTAAGLS